MSLKQDLIDVLLYVPREIYSFFADGVIAVINGISFPSNLADSSVLSPQTLYYLDFFQVDVGLTMIFSALTMRFLLRRVPVFG